MNHGRPGAAGGPAAFREAIEAYGVGRPIEFSWPAVYDAGDIIPGASLVETHDRVTEAVGGLLDLGLFPIGIGGGHDLTFPFVRAVTLRESMPLAGVYFDAHLDVRVEEGSGMPFRRLVEECGVRALHVFGLDPYANSAEHFAWFRAHGGEGGFPPDGEWPDGPTFVSLDLDVIDQAFAPGVSSMNPSGWVPSAAEAYIRSAGANPRVRCFDVMELSPLNDEGGRTARLAVRLFLAFLRGFAEREGG
jgi:arginase family enzyme